VRCGTPFSHAGIVGFLGQSPDRPPGADDVLPLPVSRAPSEAEMVSCRDAGVVGPLAGIIGTIQAGEAIKHLTGRASRSPICC
jgi:molybdopterin/thiamine biosynthesis adenylyltransferase